MIRAGDIIQSSSALQHTYFEGAKILIVDHHEQGSIGFVTNRFFGRNLSDLQEFQNCLPLPLREGGPVGQDHLYVLHRRPDQIPGGTCVVPGLYWGAEMKAVSEGLMTQQINPDDLHIFIGYCGWDGGELEEEMAEGSWEKSSGNSSFFPLI